MKSLAVSPHTNYKGTYAPRFNTIYWATSFLFLFLIQWPNKVLTRCQLPIPFFFFFFFVISGSTRKFLFIYISLMRVWIQRITEKEKKLKGLEVGIEDSTKNWIENPALRAFFV